MQVAKLDTITFAVYARIGVDLTRFIDMEYHRTARQTVRRIIAARCDWTDVIDAEAGFRERREIRCLADEVARWHAEVEPLWEMEP